MDTAQDIRGQIRSFLNENFYLDGTLRDDVSLLEQGVIDSTGVLELIAFLEERFGITVADDEMVPDYLDSVERLTAFVARKSGRAS